jgi:hypothetical protein
VSPWRPQSGIVVAEEGESAATPAILIATWVVAAGLLVASAVGLALLAAYLLTR